MLSILREGGNGWGYKFSLNHISRIEINFFYVKGKDELMKVEIMKDRDKGFMSNASYDLWQKVGSYKTVLYCAGCDLQKSCYLKQCSFSSNFYEEKFVLNIISLWVYLEYTQKNHK